MILNLDSEKYNEVLDYQDRFLDELLNLEHSDEMYIDEFQDRLKMISNEFPDMKINFRSSFKTNNYIMTNLVNVPKLDYSFSVEFIS
jgi:hypothetical protein